VAGERCIGGLSSVVMRYSGGDCSQSYTGAPDSFVQCLDFNGGPPSGAGEQAYILVVDMDDVDLVYHSASVTIGEDFVVDSFGRGIGAETMILVYSSSGMAREDLLQSTVFMSDCAQNDMAIGDNFASVQVAGFTTTTQGLITSSVDVRYIFVVGSDDNLTLTGGTGSTTPSGTVDLGIGVVFLAAGSGVGFEHTVVLDAASAEPQTLTVTLEAQNDSRQRCSQEFVKTFVVGST
jgi:hypothetical protein